MAETAAGRAPQAYFDTPERSERLQLVAHLVRNADAIPYIRGPRGAGKTRFAERLATIFRQESRLVELAGAGVGNVPEAVCQALGIPAGDWPSAAVAAGGENGLLVMIDDADRLDTAGFQALEQLRAQGGRLVFLGTSDPSTLPGSWNIQLIDLPPLNERQLRDFLEFLGQPDAVLLKDSELATLHRRCLGQPGAVKAALANGKLTHHGSPLSGLLPWRWLAGGLGVLLVLLALWQQDRINALFQAPAEPPAQPGESGSVAVPPPALPEEASPIDAPAPAPAEAVDEAAQAPVEIAIPAEPSAAEAADTGVPMSGTIAEAPAAGMPEQSQPQLSGPGDEAEPEPEPERKPEPEAEPPAPAVAITPAPVEAAASEPPAAKPEPAPKTAPRQAALLDMAWLRERQGTHYTLQLAGARDRASLQVLVKRHDLSGKCLIFERDLKGRPWYSLVCGDYRDRPAAVQARDVLPRTLRKAWPRTFDSIRQQLPK
jgi:septal ring-binding cell division protein DamX